MIALTLAFSAGVAWGSADFLAGVGCDRLALLTVLLVSQAMGLGFLLQVMIVFAKPLSAAHYIVLALVAGFFNAAAKARGLAGGAMGIVAPIATAVGVTLALAAICFGSFTIGVLGAFYPVVSILLAGVVLRERLGPAQRFGAISALAGAAFMAVG